MKKTIKKEYKTDTLNLFQLLLILLITLPLITGALLFWFSIK